MSFLSDIVQKLKTGNALAMFQKEHSVLGIDIGSSSIKVVQLKKEKERAILETYGELSLSNYTKGHDGSSMVLVNEKLQEALTDVLREAQAKTTRAIISIPLRNSFITIMPMPELSQKEMKDAVLYEE